MRILIVDDHNPTLELLARTFTRAGHIPVAARTCDEAESHATSENFDVVLLDVMLPDGSGVDLCRKLRASRVATPIMLLTALGAVGDRVAGLDAGADDYLDKPFAISELLARVRALGRRGPILRDEVIAVGEIQIDLAGRRVTVAEKPVLLTARELAIIEVLAKNRGRVVSREHLMEAVWGNVSSAVGSSLEVLLARIRRKLGGHAAPLRTVRGIGYTLEIQ